jgi:hypothetical protein
LYSALLSQLRVAYMGEKTLLVSLTCSKRTDTMVKLCEVFESLRVKIITANITTVSGRVLKTVFIEVTLFSLPHLNFSLYIISLHVSHIRHLNKKNSKFFGDKLLWIFLLKKNRLEKNFENY